MTLKKFRYRKIALAIADAFIISVAAITSWFLVDWLFGIDLPNELIVTFIVTSALCCPLSLYWCGAYSKLWRYFKKRDYVSCLLGITVGMIVTFLLVYVSKHKLPVSYIVLDFFQSLVGICLFRFLFKNAFIEVAREGKEHSAYKRTMIIGGGSACETLLKEIRKAEDSPYTDDKVSLFEPVCIIDDDKIKTGKFISDVPVVGTTSTIDKYVKTMEIEQIVLCMPSASSDDRKRILDICADTKLPVKVIPFLVNLMVENSQTSLLNQVRDIRVEELLGREPIRFDNKDIKDFINDKVCMVTGGGGSIGSELVRQIAKYNPKQVIILDIYENNAYDIQQELIMDYGNSLNLVTLIASVRDYQRMNQIFNKYKPDIVFHAAAHKHVPLMEDSPMEAIKNNVIGTFNTATLAQFYNVKKFVMVSTDKAVNPTNVMGASKRCCEMVVQYLAQQKEGTTEFVTTRFGNVLGSNGSVIPKFKRQIEQGKPVTVTHPDIIRYFMTIPEAVSLVMEAAAIAHGGEIFVLDMGQPVRIVTLAENLIRMYGKEPYKDVKIEFTGLRPGEKIKEELLMNEEGLQKTSNKLIFIGKQIDIEQDDFIASLRMLESAAAENNEQKAVAALHEMVPTFTTPEEFNKKAKLSM
ncbi:MAG: polysaccharide biosynthesis protein [Ruminococcus sp.]|nr:polysaccharide biosynthesis protein [Ruminococcus sp.]